MSRESGSFTRAGIVVGLVDLGKCTHEVADELGVAQSTVATYLQLVKASGRALTQREHEFVSLYVELSMTSNDSGLGV